MGSKSSRMTLQVNCNNNGEGLDLLSWCGKHFTRMFKDVEVDKWITTFNNLSENEVRP